MGRPDLQHRRRRRSRAQLSKAKPDGAELESTSCSKSRWRHRNTLEPAINQAIFHFLRAHNLKSAGLKLKSPIAFDCVLQSLQVIRWNGAVGDPRRNRADLVATLGLQSTEGLVAERIYFLRNEFVAHAGGWCWWDTSEYVDDDFMEEGSDLALRLLSCAADAEPGVRRIDPEPNDWGEWLLNSFSHVVPAIWFPAKSGSGFPPRVNEARISVVWLATASGQTRKRIARYGSSVSARGADSRPMTYEVAEAPLSDLRRGSRCNRTSREQSCARGAKSAS